MVVGKVRSFCFQPTCALSLMHRGTFLITNHFGKIMELHAFDALNYNALISDAQRASFVYLLLVIATLSEPHKKQDGGEGDKN